MREFIKLFVRNYVTGLGNWFIYDPTDRSVEFMSVEEIQDLQVKYGFVFRDANIDDNSGEAAKLVVCDSDNILYEDANWVLKWYYYDENWEVSLEFSQKSSGLVFLIPSNSDAKCVRWRTMNNDSHTVYMKVPVSYILWLRKSKSNCKKEIDKLLKHSVFMYHDMSDNVCICIGLNAYFEKGKRPLVVSKG